MDGAAAAVSALWLGVLTSISPCPLATNIAAVSYIGRQVTGHRAAWTGGLYVLGRVLTYVVIGGIVTAGLLSIPGVSHFLQKYLNKLLGPFLILAGIMLLGWLPFTLPGPTLGRSLQARASRGSFWGACALGAVCALSFCPVSAALFFGSLIPLAAQQQSHILLPTLYGIGTGLPVLAVGLVLAYSAKSIGRLFSGIRRFEKWVSVGTAVVFIAVGIYLILRHIFYLDL